MAFFSKIFFKLIIFFLVLSTLSFSHAEIQKSFVKSELKSQLAQRMILSFYNNQKYFGELSAYIAPDNSLESVDRKTIQKIMEKFLIKNKFDEFLERYEQFDLLTYHQLLDFGLDIVFDIKNFKIDVRISDVFLNPNHISIREHTIDKNEVDVYPSFLSGFVNYSFNQQLVKEEIQPGKSSFLTGSLDPNLNIGSAVFESHHVLDSNGNWLRSNSKASKDFVDSDIRLSVGDLNYFPRLHQTSYQYFGFSFTRSFDISPLNSTTSEGEKEIFLETPSLVEVFINGFLIQTLSLEAGKHTLDDIPISQGINHIAVKITDSSGLSKFIFFKHTGDENILKKGLHEFSYEVGTLSRFGENKILYSHDPIVSLFHRYGVKNYWTSGIDTQFKKNKIIVGAENQLGTSRGLFVHNLSFSQDDNIKRGVASKISYIWTCPCGINDQIKRLSFSYEYLSPHFLSDFVSSSFLLNNLRHTFQLTYNQKITESMSGIAQASTRSFDLKKSFSEQLSAGVNYKLTEKLFSNLFWTNNYTIDSPRSTSIMLQVNYNFDGGKKNVVGSFNQSEKFKNEQVEYTHNLNKAVNNSIYRARVSGDENKKNGFLGNYLNTQFYELGTTLEYQSFGKKKEFNINPSGSLSFLENRLTLGQRIHQSYILVDNELRESVIINGDQDNYEAYLAPNSRTVLTAVQPYIAKSVSVISDDNKSLGLSNKEYRVKANYKSGTYLKLGNSLTKTIEGVLVNELGIPLSLAGAKLVDVSSGIEIPFFTGRNGVFYVDNVKPNNYQLIVYEKLKITALYLDLTNKLLEERNNLGRIIVK